MSDPNVSPILKISYTWNVDAIHRIIRVIISVETDDSINPVTTSTVRSYFTIPLPNSSTEEEDDEDVPDLEETEPEEDQCSAETTSANLPSSDTNSPDVSVPHASNTVQAGSLMQTGFPTSRPPHWNYTWDQATIDHLNDQINFMRTNFSPHPLTMAIGRRSSTAAPLFTQEEYDDVPDLEETEPEEDQCSAEHAGDGAQDGEASV
ncbi:hypothetical protein KCU95_g10829, partial [Aureobasidium melanogenum]